MTDLISDERLVELRKHLFDCMITEAPELVLAIDEALRSRETMAKVRELLQVMREYDESKEDFLFDLDAILSAHDKPQSADGREP